MLGEEEENIYIHSLNIIVMIFEDDQIQYNTSEAISRHGFYYSLNI